jgi:adenine phosphoribosyltransferase
VSARFGGLAPADVGDVLRPYIGSTRDFPVTGIDFKDITPLLADADAFPLAIDELHARVEQAELDADGVLAIESRGFVVGAPLAALLRRGVVLVRKPGKLPGQNDAFEYACEYCTGTLEVRPEAVQAGRRYIVVDDLLATGGTARATADYVLGKDASVAGYCFLVELTFLRGRELLDDAPVISLVEY